MPVYKVRMTQVYVNHEEVTVWVKAESEEEIKRIWEEGIANDLDEVLNDMEWASFDGYAKPDSRDIYDIEELEGTFIVDVDWEKEE